jgi:hypothetical protein
MSTPRMRLAKSADLLDCSRGRAYPLPTVRLTGSEAPLFSELPRRGIYWETTRLVLAMVVRRGNDYTRLFAESL